MLMHDPDYAGTVEIDDVGSTLMRLGADKDAEGLAEAKLFAAAHKVPTWKALGIVLFRSTRKKRKVVP